MLWFALAFARFRLTGRFVFLALIQLAAALIVWSATVPFFFYLDVVDWGMLVLLFPAQLAILAVLLINGFEFTEVLWRKRWLRHFGLLQPDPPERQPFVSIHLACYNEPPEMVIATLDSLAALDYHNFEVLVIDNNTRNEEVWKPVEAYCAKLGPHFRFFHLNPWPGFKAGALNYGLKETDPRAEVIAAIDADYVVRPDWLSALTGYFHDQKVAVVQCPQAHRDFAHNAFRRMTNWESDGFFRIGMHHRNERNAIIQHGTMTMVRRSALEGTGGWSEWTICEDAELGLRLMHAGYDTVYVDEVMGRGLTPADFTAYKSQRYRWAFGAMQIMKGRWNWMVRRGPLGAGQRFHFLTGWFSWFADALHLVFTLMALAWTVGMLAWPVQETGRVRAHSQAPQAHGETERIRFGTRGIADGDRVADGDRRHDAQLRRALSGRPVVDGDPRRAGDPVCFGADRRVGRASFARRRGRKSRAAVFGLARADDRDRGSRKLGRDAEPFPAQLRRDLPAHACAVRVRAENRRGDRRRGQTAAGHGARRRRHHPLRQSRRHQRHPGARAGR